MSWDSSWQKNDTESGSIPAASPGEQEAHEHQNPRFNMPAYPMQIFYQAPQLAVDKTINYFEDDGGGILNENLIKQNNNERENPDMQLIESSDPFAEHSNNKNSTSMRMGLPGYEHPSDDSDEAFRNHHSILQEVPQILKFLIVLT